MKDFIAIDFETANECRSSVCSVGIVIVVDGKITDSFYSLIKPVPNYYSYWNIQVHGITERDTRNAETFPEVWAKIENRIKDLPFVAHNSSFDEGCLKSVFQYYDLYYPNYKFHCTRRQSKKVFGKELENHKLDTVARHCGFNLRNHHHALADAEACAAITMKIFE